MRCSRGLRAGAFGIGLACIGAAHAAGDAEAGRIKAEPCMGCHGVAGYTNAYPNYHVPRVGGQAPDYIVAALKEYAAGQRPHPTMHAQAATLSDQDMEDIAAFFSGNPE